MKKFLQKILGSKETPAVNASRDLRQRSPRVRIPSLDRSVFISSNGKRFPLRNLSETGMALLCQGERFPEEMNGSIQVGEEQVYVELLVVRREGDEVGVSIVDGASEVRGLLRRFFAEEFHALEMTEVDVTHQKAVDLGRPRWFYAPGNYELFLVEHEGAVIRFELGWGSDLIAYGDKGLRYGKVEREQREGMSHAGSALVNWMEQVSPEQKLKAVRILENIPSLDTSLRQRLQALIR